MGERLTWAIDRKHFGINELGKAAGVTGAIVSKLSRRTEPIAGHAATLLKLALALDVSPAWLAFGLGEPLDESVVPARERAATLCRECRVAEEAIRSVLDEVVSSDTELPVLVWVDRMRLREAEIRAGRVAM